ncbi:acyltransferase family protein [Chelatococcus reniformis]
MLRAVAALAVVVHHSLEVSEGAPGHGFSPDWLTTCGAAGVDIFFVISGFIMVYVSFPPGRRTELPATFLARRVVRIYPLYWICSAMILLIFSIGLLRNQNFDLMTVLNSAILLPGHKLIPMAWTLSFEMYFYIVFAACLLLANVYASSLAVIAVIVSGIVIGRILPPSTFSEFVGSPLVLEFCFGLILALLVMRGGLRIPPRLSIVGFGLLAAAPAFIAHPSTNGLPDTARVLAWGLPATLIVAAFVSIGPPRSAAARTAVAWGDASYSLYLTHAFVMIAYGWLLKFTFIGTISQIMVVPLVVAACIAVGLVTHVVVERPLVSLGRRLTGRPRSEGGMRPATQQVDGEMSPLPPLAAGTAQAKLR